MMPEEPEHLALDVPLQAGEARCGLIRFASETLLGPGAYTEPGKAWRCYNARVRFGGATADGAVGLALYGGALLDADIQRDDNLAGEDRLREIFPIPGLMGVQVTSVTASNTPGEPSRVRVEGHSAPLGVLPQVVLFQHPFIGRVTTEFVMHPDVEYLEMTTTVYNDEARVIDIMLGDFLSLGKGVRAWTPETGFGDAALFQTVSIYAGTSEQVSYAYTLKEGTFTIPLVDAGGTGTLVKPDAMISDQESYTRYLAVGNGSLASAVAIAHELRGQTLGTLQVSLQMDGHTTPGLVTLYHAPVAEDSVAANQIRVGDSGTARERIVPGTYVVKTQAPGAPVTTAAQTVTITSNQTTEATITLMASARVTFTAHEVDEAGMDLGPVPAKLSVVATDGAVVDEDFEPRPSHGLLMYRVAAHGHLTALLPAGSYRFVVSRGPEYTLITDERTLSPGETVELDAPLQRVLNTEGLLAAEFHQHTLGSLDSSTDLLTKVIENAAEGVELAACTDHDNVKDYAPYVESAGLSGFFVGWAGNEISYNGVGHFNAYPLTVDGRDPFRDTGARLWAGRTVAELFSSLRFRSENPVIHVSHPRASGGKGYFAQVKLNPISGVVHGQTGDVLAMVPEGTLTTLAEDFDAIEVNGETAEPSLLEPGQEAELERRAMEDPTEIPTMVDWFHLLLTGRHVAALGNSDSHDFNSGSGWPRNYIVVADDRPDAITTADIRDAIVGQRLLVSNGLVVIPRLDSALRLGKEDAVAVDSTVVIELTIESADWVGGASEVTAFLDGRPLHFRTEGETVNVDSAGAAVLDLNAVCSLGVCRQHLVFHVPLSKDGWVVFVAKGNQNLSPVGSGNAWGYTNPVYLDLHGNGWQP
jgi:hypothetical protein